MKGLMKTVIFFEDSSISLKAVGKKIKNETKEHFSMLLDTLSAILLRNILVRLFEIGIIRADGRSIWADEGTIRVNEYFRCHLNLQLMLK